MWLSGRGTPRELGPKGWKKHPSKGSGRTGVQRLREPCEFKVLEEAGGGGERVGRGGCTLTRS